MTNKTVKHVLPISRFPDLKIGFYLFYFIFIYHHVHALKVTAIDRLKYY